MTLYLASAFRAGWKCPKARISACYPLDLFCSYRKLSLIHCCCGNHCFSHTNQSDESISVHSTESPHIVCIAFSMTIRKLTSISVHSVESSQISQQYKVFSSLLLSILPPLHTQLPKLYIPTKSRQISYTGQPNPIQNLNARTPDPKCLVPTTPKPPS